MVCKDLLIPSYWLLSGCFAVPFFLAASLCELVFSVVVCSDFLLFCESTVSFCALCLPQGLHKTSCRCYQSILYWEQLNFTNMQKLYPFTSHLFTLLMSNFTVGSQREELHPWQRSWGRKLSICKGVIKPLETPCSWACTPKTRVLHRGLSPITISLEEGVNLQLQLIKIPGRDKSVSPYELWRFSGMPDQARPAACDCLQPPNCERHGMF